VNTYIAAQRYTRLAHSLPAGSGTTVAESLRPGTRFELREAAQPARFWGVTVLENVGGGGASGLLGLGYDSPDLKPRAADLRLGCSPKLSAKRNPCFGSQKKEERRNSMVEGLKAFPRTCTFLRSNKKGLFFFFIFCTVFVTNLLVRIQMGGS
jgi:hypothetical protein